MSKTPNDVFNPQGPLEDPLNSTLRHARRCAKAATWNKKRHGIEAEARKQRDTLGERAEEAWFWSEWDNRCRAYQGAPDLIRNEKKYFVTDWNISLLRNCDVRYVVDLATRLTPRALDMYRSRRIHLFIVTPHDETSIEIAFNQVLDLLLGIA